VKLCTDKVVADFLDLTPRRVRQLRDEGVIAEKAVGLYDLRAAVRQYVTYLRNHDRADLNDERAMLTRCKREAVEMENELRRGVLLNSEEVEKGIKAVCLSIRSRILTLPAKLAPKLAEMGGNQAGIFDELKRAVDESLEELSRFDLAAAMEEGSDGGQEEGLDR